MNLKFEDIIIIIVLVIAVIGVILYFVNKKASKQIDDAQAFIKQNKNTISIFVIDKKRDKIENINLPKAVTDNITGIRRMQKLYFVQAKVGAQITTLICDKTQFNQLNVKKTYKVDIAGIYIVDVKGVKKDDKKMSLAEKARQSYLNGKE